MPSPDLFYIIDLLQRANTAGIIVSAEDAGIRLKIKKGHLVDKSLLAELGNNKSQLIEYFSLSAMPKAGQHSRPEKIPLSFSQERLWFIDQLQGSVPYHIPWVFRLQGEVDRQVLEESLRLIVTRHEVLRSVILENDGMGYQQPQDPERWSMTYIEHDGNMEEQNIEPFVEQLIFQPFDLSSDMMLKVWLIRINPHDHILVSVVHHIAFDGWSIAILVEELVEIYSSRIRNKDPQLTDLPFQYADHAIWQRLYLQQEVMQQHIAYWQQHLQGCQPTEIMTDRDRPPTRKAHGHTLHHHLSHNCRQQVAELSRQQKVSPFMTLLAIFKILLHRYTHQSDICVGTPIAGRHHPDVEKLIGFFINTLPLRTQLDGNSPFTSFLRQVKTTTLDAYEHQDIPFEKIVEALHLARDKRRNPLFQIMFAMQNIPATPQLALHDHLTLTRLFPDKQTSKFDLSLHVSESTDGLHLSMTYDSDLFGKSSIQRLLHHFEHLITAVLDDPETTIDRLPMLDAGETHTLLTSFNPPDPGYPLHRTMIDLFEEQARQTPQAIALIHEEGSLTYHQLNEQAGNIAAWLQDNKVQPQQPVAIAVTRSPDTITAILGILKAGAAYVPVDPGFPADRVHYILEDTACSICLADDAFIEKITPPPNILFASPADIRHKKRSRPLSNTQPRHLAYIIYTSGSTGRPKGVMIEHRALADHIHGIIRHAGLHACSSFALFASLVADAGHSILFASLISGAALHVLSDRLLQHKDHLQEYFYLHHIDCIKIVPSLWLSYAETGAVILPEKVIIFGGEAFPPPMLDTIRLAGYKGDIFNHYGPTETTIGKCIHKIDAARAYGNNIPIGSPFSYTKAYILDPRHRIVPIGVPGELYLAGDGLARGYLNQPALSNEKFIPNPFDGTLHTKMYRTGDMARWLDDGHIQFLGRFDDQIKIRGYRIEPAEIEAALERSPHVQQSVVILTSQAGKEPTLVAFFIPIEPYTLGDIRAHLRRLLPDYMIPAVFVTIDRIPLLPSGKTDKKSLANIDTNAREPRQYDPPSSETEHALAKIWQQLLQIDKVGIHDDFFELGGHSLLAMRMAAEIKKNMDLFIPIGKIFQLSNIMLLAQFLDMNSMHSPERQEDDYATIKI